MHGNDGLKYLIFKNGGSISLLACNILQRSSYMKHGPIPAPHLFHKIHL
jgi:hypothetical protein